MIGTGQLQAKPPPPEFYESFNKGCELVEQGQMEEGEGLLAKACKICPEAWIALGCEAVKTGDNDAAKKRFDEVLRIAPRTAYTARAAAENNLGMIVANTQSRAASEAYFRRALAIYGNYADAMANLGLALKWRGATDEALYWLEKCLDTFPHHGQAEFSRSTALLAAGRFKEGWEAYEARWRMEGGGIRKLDVPVLEWEGQGNCSVFVYGEQGAGDCLQLVRYIPVLASMGIEVHGGFQKPLVNLFAATKYFHSLIIPDAPLPKTDYQVPIFSIPRILKLWTEQDIPNKVPYLFPTEPVSYGDGFHVGIIWKGGKSFKNDFFRSTTLKQWEPILSVKGVTFHSLQVAEDAAKELEEFPHVKTYPPPADFLDTANRMAGCDIIISTDTSTAHLAGAIGKPVWMLCGLGGDFRWLFGRKDSPWYPTMRIFRQVVEQDWSTVVNDIAHELSQKIR